MTEVTKAPLTKEQRIAAIDAQIAKLQQRRVDIENGVVTARPAKKVAALPELGSEVAFTYGRKTATSDARELVGVVIGVKPKVDGAEGKPGSPALVKVRVGDGFDAELLTIYPAQIKAAPAAEPVADEGAAE